MFGRAPDRDQHLVAATGAPSSSSSVTLAVARDRASPSAPSGRRRRAARSASCTCSRGERLLARDQPRGRLDQRHLRAERRERLRQLDADDAAAEDEQPLGHASRAVVASRLVHGCASRRPGIGGIAALAAGGDHDRAARDSASRPPTRRGARPAGAPWPRTSVDAALLEPRQLRAVVEVVDHLVAAREHRRDVELAGDRLGRAGHPPRLGERLGRAQQRLRRHARLERALAADQLALDDRDLQAASPSRPAHDLAGRAGADHDHVELSLAHGWHPDGMPRVIVVPLLAAFILISACGGSKGSASTGTPPARPAAGHLHLAKVGSFDSPVFVTAPPGDTHRVFVVEQAGRIRVIRDGKMLAQPFLDIRRRVISGGEQGLLSMAFAPDYARSRRFYVYFTDRQGDERDRRVPARRRRRPRGRPSMRATLVQSDQRGQPQRRAAAVRAGRVSVRRPGRRRRRRRPARRRAATRRTSARCSARSCASTRERPAGGRTAIPREQPVRRARAARAGRDLRLRPAQPLALLVRPQRPATWSSATSARTRSRRSTSAAHGTARGVNFGWRPWEGRRRNFDEPAPGAVFPLLHEAPLRRLVLDHRRLRGARSRARLALRALRLRRLLQGRDLRRRSCRRRARAATAPIGLRGAPAPRRSARTRAGASTSRRSPARSTAWRAEGGAPLRGASTA